MFTATSQLSRARAAALTALFGLAAAMPAMAADSVNVTVNANVIGVCKFFGGPYSMTIANSGSDIDPSLATTATGTVGVTYRCTKGQTPTLGVPGTLTLTGPESMDATFTFTSGGAGTGMGAAHDKTLTINGEILEAEFQNKEVGAYSGTLTVTINP
jgi:hypothetical protein